MAPSDALHSPRISRATARHMERLLFMEYKPSELAGEIGVSTKTIYNTYIPAGLPHRRDGKNIWIVGTEFKTWAESVLQKGSRYASQRRAPLTENQSWCIHCRAVMEFKKITDRIPHAKNSVQLKGPCAKCGKPMFRFAKGAK
jgi:hypothetical protein